MKTKRVRPPKNNKLISPTTKHATTKTTDTIFAIGGKAPPPTSNLQQERGSRRVVMLVLLLVKVVLVFFVDPYVVCGFYELRVLCFTVGLIVFYKRCDCSLLVLWLSWGSHCLHWIGIVFNDAAIS